MTTQNLTAKKTRPLHYLGGYLFLAAIALSVLAFFTSQNSTQVAWQHPVVSPEGGFILAVPPTQLSVLGWVALAVLVAALVFTARNAMAVPSLLTAAIIMLSMILGVLTVTVPGLVSASTIKSASSQAAFDAWSAARYDIDTSVLDTADHTLLMRMPDPERKLSSADLRVVRLPDGTLLQAVSDNSGARYLMTALDSELPVIAEQPAK